MTNLLKIYFFLFFCTWSTIAIAGKVYFVDFSANVNGLGTLEKPWNNLNAVNNFKFQTGDDVYFKCGTTSSGSERFTVDWSGTENDRVIIGAYYSSGGSPAYGINVDGRPVIQGVLGSYPGAYTPFIYVYGQSYVTIKDIKFLNSGAHAVLSKNTSFLTLSNLYSQYSSGPAILLGSAGVNLGTRDSIVENCTVERSSYDTKGGAGIVVTAMFYDGSTKDIIVRNNIVFNAHEGIGVYKTASYVTVENNIIYDCKSFHAYTAGGSHHVTWRNNLVYNTASFTDRKFLFSMNNESHETIPPRSYGDIEIYDNYIAGGLIGVSMGNSSASHGLIPSNISIYNNRIVDCDNNIKIWDGFNAKNVKIDNNISGIYTSGLRHVGGNTGHTGVTWNGNTYNSEVTGRPATNSIIADRFTKTSNWRNLSPGDVTYVMFDLKVGIAGNNQTILPAPLHLRVQYN